MDTASSKNENSEPGQTLFRKCLCFDPVQSHGVSHDWRFELRLSRLSPKGIRNSVIESIENSPTTSYWVRQIAI